MGKRLLEIILRRETILIAFVVATIADAVLDAVADRGGWFRVCLSVFAFPTLAWFTYKRQLIVTWATILLLLLIGSGYLYDSFTALAGPATAPFAVHLFKIAAGIYLTWGALVLHRERHLVI